MSDASKAMEAVYKVAILTDPPLRLPLGKDILAMIRNKQEMTALTLEKYSEWSGDLGTDSYTQFSYVTHILC